MGEIRSRPTRETTNSPSRRTIAIAIGWLALLACGFASLIAYSQTPGATASPPSKRNTTLRTWELVLGIHPKCPCSWASISELQRLLRRTEGSLACTILVYVPNGETDFAETQMVRTASALRDCEIVLDSDGKLAEEVGILTSGGCVLYDANGILRFQGGITPSRGHEGGNVGTQAILSLVRGDEPAVKSSAVYGCRMTPALGGRCDR